MVAVRGPGWGLAPCLVDLIHECDELAPNRSTISDGSVGDSAHAARTSDHNPEDGWVCAVDVTDDKAGGCDADLLARHLVASRDPRVKYLIWNGTIVKSYVDSAGHPAWQPYPYTGTNAHEKHTHISVHNTAAARNDLSPWWPQDEPPAVTPEEIDMLIVKATGKPSRLLAPPAFVNVGDATIIGLSKAGVKTVTLTGKEYDALRAQIVRALDED